MDFGDFLRQEREKRDLGVRDLAELSQVDSSTISRGENHKTEVSILTAYKVCRALGISAQELYKQLAQASFDRLWECTSASQTLEQEVSAFHSNRAYYEKKLDELFATPSSGMLPYYLSPPPAFQPAQLSYPICTPGQIFTWYEHNNVLLASDAETYAENRRKHGTVRLPIGSLRAKGHINSGDSLGRTNISGVLAFDQQENEQGAIFGMYWRACDFYNRFSRTELSLRIAVLCLILHRWEKPYDA